MAVAAESEIATRVPAQRGSDRAFAGVCALLFTASAALTSVWCGAMSATSGMPMPGGWTMSMAWMPMPGETWLAAAASFVGMWIAMMVAMMLPSLVPVLRRHRGAIRVAGDAHANRSIALVGAGYFAVWTVFGAIAFPLGVALAAIEMEHPALARAVPTAVGVVVGIAGTVQLTAWKSRRLAACRNATAQGAALRRGVRLGLECVQCCANWMAILLVVGVMDLGAMAVVAVAITAERLAPNGQRVARVAGLVAVAAGSILIARAVGIE